ncbi:MAG: bifunctional UDP-sugar hydrolase/5'-nucleotidase [Candidatus Krumholzibacteria bacterium]|nr:bifunctional UDP-sugar hydrolase/5'-nucleotidase [Candidatus Krumholzibacteria bacterium]
MKTMRPARTFARRPAVVVFWLAVGLGAGLGAGCGAGGAGAARAESTPQAVAEGPFDLTLFHTNDIHGGFFARPYQGGGGSRVGGFAALAEHLARERASAARWLLLDAGDFMTGNPVCELTVAGAPGGAMAAMMGAAGYHAGVIGNHEFDLGRDALDALMSVFPFPLLAADLVDAAGRTSAPGLRGPLVLERDGLRIGMMGISFAALPAIVARSRLDGIESRDQTARVREQLADLVGRTDVQVLISHNGVDPDRALARELAADGLDVIVGGHSHTRLEEPLVEAGVVIVQAGSGLRHLGRLDLRLADGRVTHYRGRLVLLDVEGGASAATQGGAVAGEDADPDAPLLVRDLVAHYESTVASVYEQVIGRLTTDLRRHSRQESALGSWLCDILRAHTGADVAVYNSGGIRKHLTSGPVTKLDIFEVLPFGNSLVVHRLPGSSLRAILLANAQAAETDAYGILQVSGVEYRYREDNETRAGGRRAQANGAAVELISVTVGGQPLRDDRIYTVAMPDYVSGMGDVFLGGVALTAPLETGERITDIVIAAVEKIGGVITPPRLGRIEKVGKR